MRGVNKAIIVGRLGNDPVVKQFNNGSSVTHISVATSEQWNDKQTGEKKEATEWHRISLFNRLGEIAAQYLKKGSAVYIEGSLRTNKYTDQNGIERYATEIRADNLQMLDSNNMGNSQNNSYGNNNYQNNGNAGNNGYNNANNNGGYPQQGYNNQNNGQNFNQNSGAGYPNQSNSNQGSPQHYPQGQGGFNGSNPPQPQNNPFMNESTTTPPVSPTPKAGVVDDDVPFSYISPMLASLS